MGPTRALRTLRRIEDPSELEEDVFRAAKFLVLCGLPYRSTNGSVTRTARTGKDSYLEVTYAPLRQEIGLPYGTDRALFGFLQTQTFATGSMALTSVKKFFDAIGVFPSMREYAKFRERLGRIANLAVELNLHSPGLHERTVLTPIKNLTEPTEWTPDSLTNTEAELTGQLTLLTAPPARFFIELDPSFHAYLQNNWVALPMRLMRTLHQSPVAYDFAQWVLWRSISARRTAVVPFIDLLDQLGGSSNVRRLRSQYADILTHIRLVYPDFPALMLRGTKGLHIEPWKPPAI